MVLFFTIFFALYGTVNYYIFIRGWQSLSAFPTLRIIYIILFIISSLSYFAAKLFANNLPAFFYDLLLWIGSIWFAYILYFFLSIVIIDLIRLLNWKFNFYPAFIKNNYQNTKQITALAIFLISSIIIFFGYLNTRNIKINSYEIELKKKNSNLTELNLILVADFHITPVNDGTLLKKIVEKINSLNADIILMPGDIVDDKVEILRRRNIGADFLNIRSKYGVFASNGNHEFISGIKESVKYMRDFNINVLEDSAQLIDNSFYIICRDDRSKRNFTEKERKSLEEILTEVNKNYPIIVLDHTPLELDIVEKNKIDLQLSGHTHHGQLFPLNLITGMIYEVSWGYLKKNDSQFYVTSGVGTWGPPVRTGSDAEIVNLKIKFVE
jgi:predicted MPP superfamily phosphohydrolase